MRVSSSFFSSCPCFADKALEASSDGTLSSNFLPLPVMQSRIGKKTERMFILASSDRLCQSASAFVAFSLPVDTSMWSDGENGKFEIPFHTVLSNQQNKIAVEIAQ